MEYLTQYQHGGNIFQWATKLNCSANEIIDFSSNINFIKPTLNYDFYKGINLETYPDPDYGEIKSEIKVKYNISESHDLELFNGASAGIYSFFKWISVKNIVLYSPIYLEYSHAANLQKMNIVSINRLANIDEDIPEQSVVIFVNPSTPDGHHYELLPLFKKWKHKRAIVLIDESFLDFSGYPSLLNQMDYDHLYILKSFTKFYGYAGIRIGAIISTKANIKSLAKHEPPWKLSTFDSQFLIRALRDKELFNKTHNAVNENRSRLIEICQNSSLFNRVFNSTANFILTELKQFDAYQFQKYLEPFKILIRPCDNFDYLNQHHTRLAVKDKNSISKLAKALQQIEKEYL